jgi:hypothetical protein
VVTKPFKDHFLVRETGAGGRSRGPLRLAPATRDHPSLKDNL